MPYRSALGAAIRARRLEMGLTQEQLAERISSDDDYVRQSEVSRLESGHVGLPRRARLERIAAALQLPLGELLARSGWAGAVESFELPGDAPGVAALESVSSEVAAAGPDGRSDGHLATVAAFERTRRSFERSRRAFLERFPDSQDERPPAVDGKAPGNEAGTVHLSDRLQQSSTSA